MDGFVFATTGDAYTTLARRAARTLRLVMPDVAVDLFTDQTVEDDVFDRVHRVRDGWFRPKMEALAGSRFRRTIYLDADVLVVADISDVFDLLGRYQIVGTHGRYANDSRVRRYPDRHIPPAFPQINGGVIGSDGSPAARRLAALWEDRLRVSGERHDQPELRRLLWEGAATFYAMPPQYNFNSYHEIGGWDHRCAAPRVIHAPILHRRPNMLPPDVPIHPREVMSAAQLARLAWFAQGDHSLEGRASLRLPTGRAARLLAKMRARFA